MPYAVRWYVENRVLATLNWGELTAAEIEETNNELRKILDATPQVLHVVVDTRRVARLPQGFDRMLRAMRVVQTKPTFQMAIMVSTSPLLRFFGVLVSNLTKARYGTVENFAIANSVLERGDPSLVGLLPNPDEWERVYDDLIAST